MNIYVASSWRNTLQPEVVRVLREMGHEVYDFRNPPGGTGFGWDQVNPNWKITDGEKGFVAANDYKQMLAHPIAARGFKSDMDALRAADAVVYVLPCGRSASWEFGWAAGAGKATYVVWFGAHEPELMFRDAEILGSWEDLREAFKPVVKTAEPNCRACAHCYMEPDSDFICGHPDAGTMGLYVKHAAADGGHCGPSRPKFAQHPLRQANGDLR